jgi:hypothetical protein
MGNFIDRSGQTFGQWKVIRQADSNNGRTMWWCICSCNRTEKAIPANYLVSKTRTNMCMECLHDTKKVDLTKMRFGMLVAQHETGRMKDGRITWLCLCDCGKYKTAAVAQLNTGNITSCGCYQQDFRNREVQRLAHKEQIPRIEALDYIKSMEIASEHLDFNLTQTDAQLRQARAQPFAGAPQFDPSQPAPWEKK